ncbi:MAG: flagellar M-ring protein FliF [Lachnoclostridium sp.]|nr:flagellar M-ring protein FliF [Lachnospira sp.]MCM1246817.1 flagellar M-ring protein FliF [Lachnoclostridium sp.]MCM1535396.1 flagellar M-ring protein FliF [Clostridium sp.]
MADRLREIPAKVLAWWSRFTTRQKNVIIGITAAVILAFAIIIYIVSKPQYTRLMTCDNTKQASEVIDILNSANIKHKESADGLKIEVENKKIGEANLAMGAAGYVPDGYGIEDALSSSLSTTASDRAKRYKFYMEEKLSADFEAMPAIKSARISLNIPDQDGTLTAQQEEPGAFIQLELADTFTSAQAANMAKAVKSYLGCSTTANITIIDNEANMLFVGGDDYSTAGVASSMQELQNQAQSMVANQTKRLLYGTKQFNNIEVTSYLDVDFASYEKTIKEYYANEGRDEGLIAHQSTFESENTNNGGGIPGTDSNNENNYVFQNGSDSSSTQSEMEVDRLPNEMSEYQNIPPGSIDYANSSLSVALVRYREVKEEDVRAQGLLDGTTWQEYKLNNSADVKMEVDEDYYQMVANATGISADRITIIAYESPIFYDREGFKLTPAAAMSGILFILILGLLAFVVLRSMLPKKAVEEEEELSVEDMLQSAPELEDIDVESKSETRKVIEKFVDENPEAAALLLRNWLNEDWN